MRANRAFLGGATRYLAAETGMRQCHGGDEAIAIGSPG